MSNSARSIGTDKSDKAIQGGAQSYTTQPVNSGIDKLLLGHLYIQDEKLRRGGPYEMPNVIHKVIAVMSRQRNINIDVQSGVSELEELIDILKSYMENWKVTKKEKEANRAIEIAKDNRNDCQVFTPVSPQNKKGASSLAWIRPEKRPRGKPKDMAHL